MNWYQGGIAEAITTAKAKGAIFVVYIEGKDEKSTQITQLLNNADVVSQLGSEKFVAIKLEADSVPHQQFKQFYQTTPVPSIYFLGKNGVPIKIVTDLQDPQTFSTTMNSILDQGNDSTKPSVSDSLIKSEQASSSATPPANAVCENGVCTIKKDEAATVPASNQTTVEEPPGTSSSPEDKVERAKQIIEIKRAQKQKEEEEKERQKEIERRKMGQNVQQLKRWKEDEEMKQLLEDRERERREGQAAKDRVLAQIAQDKAERAARFPNSQQSPVQQQPQVASQSTPRSANRNTARIQFRMPDGSTRTSDFSSSETLEALHAFIRNNLNLPFPNYTLSTTFPRREFTEEDKNRTLMDLELVPTSVILILPINRGAVSTNPGGGYTEMLWYILTPIFNVLGFLRTFIFGTAPTNPPPGNTNAAESTNKRTADTTNEPPRVVIKKRAPGGETTVIRRQGNIHRLSNRTDSDDENNTWNGNSTQQM